LTRIIGQEWNDLPKEKKIRYEIEAKENKEKYYAELEEYLDKNPRMRELIEESKSKNKKKSKAPVIASQGEKPSIHVLESSDDEDEEASQVDMKSYTGSSRSSVKKAFSSSDSDSDDDESSEDDEPKPAKKVKK